MVKSSKRETQFVRGLITEAGELTFPEHASVDELNCDLSRKGNRRRRLGLQYEDSYELSDAVLSKAGLVSTSTWENVGGQASLQYLVVQLRDRLYFYNKGILPLSGQAIPTSNADSTVYYVDLNNNAASGLGGAATAKVSVTSVNGALVVVSAAIDPFYVERDRDTGVFTETSIVFTERDYEFQGDITTYKDKEASPSDLRIYDTMNCGWDGDKGEDALDTYTSSQSAYPPLTHHWYAGKNSSNEFTVGQFNKVASGTSLIGNGYYILDIFDKDRQAASGLSGVENYVEPSRFSTVATYAGRAWYSGLTSSKGSSKVYFSRLAQDISEVGECLQRADPTSESAILVDTDGGFINLPEAHNIQRLAVLGPTLVVFAENGVWQISGVDDVFRASEYSVRKVTDIGLINPQTFVDAEGSFLWWSPSGVHSLGFDQTAGTAKEQNISISTIQTFWDDIGAEERSRCVSEYDYVNKKVFWLFPSKGEANQQKKNRLLILDVILQAFYPWEVEDTAGETPYLVGMSFFKGVGSGAVEYNVVDSLNNQVVDSSGNEVVATFQGQINTGNSAIKFLVRDGDTGSITFADFRNTDFVDWEEASYTSYAEAGYDFMGDMTTRKTAPYVSVSMGVTETGWSGNEEEGYNRVRPSSLLVSAYWDFKDTPATSAQQAYRLKLLPVVDPNNLDNFGYPHSVVSTRLKLRGRGQSVRLRFESEEGKDFNLLGYEVIGERSNKL